MPEYKNKKELIDEISIRAKLFIDEFSDIPEAEKDKLVDGVDRTPAQMIAYQLGWINLISECCSIVLFSNLKYNIRLSAAENWA